MRSASLAMITVSKRQRRGIRARMPVSALNSRIEAWKSGLITNAGIWTQLALAYAIHKSFIFLRVPLTAAVTPKVVKTLRGWGWDVGKRRPKVPKDTKID